MAQRLTTSSSLGSGPGGYVAAIRAAQLGLKTGDRRARAARRHLPQLGLHPDQGAAALGRDLPPDAARQGLTACRREDRADLDAVVKRPAVAAQQSSGRHAPDEEEQDRRAHGQRQADGPGQAHGERGKDGEDRRSPPSTSSSPPAPARATCRARSRRQARLDLSPRDDPAEMPNAAGHRLGRDRHRVRQLLRHGRRGDRGRDAGPACCRSRMRTSRPSSKRRSRSRA